MILRVALAVGLLVMVESQASDTAAGSNAQGFLSKYLLSGDDSSKNSFGHHGKFITPNLMHMKHGNGPAALAHHNNPAEHGPAIGDTQHEKDEENAMQKMLAKGNSKTPISLSAIAVGLLSLVAMLGVRIQRGLQPASNLASSGGLGSDMSINTAPGLGQNLLEMKQ